MAVTQADIDSWRAQFEKSGVGAVRMNIEQHQYDHSPPFKNAAIEWLAEKDQEERRLNDASQAEQREIARSAKDAAWAAARAAERAATAAEKANTRATIALVIAAISIIASAIGIFVVHHDSSAPHATETEVGRH